MTTNSVEEALKQASGGNNQDSKPNQKPQESSSILNDRNSLAENGYIDGMWASQDYIEGLRKGLNDGIIQGRQRLIREFNRDLKTIRQAPLTIDLSHVCDNFPIIESKPIFQLPKGA